MLVSAFRRNELLLGLINIRRLQTTKKVREGETPSPARETRALPRIDPTNSRERPLIGPCDHSKINFFQPLHLLLQVKFFSHCVGASRSDARKQTGILCRVEQCSR